MIPTCRDHLASPGPLGESAIGGNRASLSFPLPWPLPRSESAEYAKLFSASGNKLPRKRAGGTLATHSNLHQSTGPGGLTNFLPFHLRTLIRGRGRSSRWRSTSRSRRGSVTPEPRLSRRAGIISGTADGDANSAATVLGRYPSQ